MKPIHQNRKMCELKYHGRVFERGTIRWFQVLIKSVFEVSFLKKFGLQNAQKVGLNQIELQVVNLPA